MSLRHLNSEEFREDFRELNFKEKNFIKENFKDFEHKKLKESFLRKPSQHSKDFML